MRINPFLMEEWLGGYRFKVEINLAESGMRDLTLRHFLAACDSTPEVLQDLVLEDMPTMGSPYLREAIARTYPIRVAPENVLVTTGTSEALFLLFCLVLDPGCRVVTSAPAFQALYEVPRALGAELVFYEHRFEEGFRFDAARFCALITPDTRLVIVNNPHNPTGAVADAAFIERVVARTAEVGAVLLFDEHYRFLPHDSSLDMLPSAAGLGPHVYATGSITKCFGAMGLRMGWLVGDPAMLARARDQRDYLTHTLSPISEKLAALALLHRHRFLDENRRLLRENKAALAHFMATHRDRFAFVPPEAGVVCFPHYTAPLPSRVVVQRLIDETGVFVLPGHSFEREGFIRIGLGAEPARFATALERLDGFAW